VAKRTVQMLIDDIDGGDADETITFALDGTQYEIDLSKQNAAKLREALAPYVGSGTRTGRGAVSAGRSTATRGRGAVKADRDQNRAIREWAQAKGLEVSDRGRIKQEIVDRYNTEAGR
jgi:hypothetical protein